MIRLPNAGEHKELMLPGSRRAVSIKRPGSCQKTYPSQLRWTLRPSQRRSMATTIAIRSESATIAATVPRRRNWVAMHGGQPFSSLHQYVSSLTDTSRDATDRRGRVEESRNKNARTANPDNKSEDQDAGPKEDRRPKRKVAVMIGYSGTGYKGMQMCI